MATFTIDIPDEVVDHIKQMGYDMNSWITQKLIRPTMDHYEEGQRKKEIEKVEPQIKTKVDNLRKQIKLEKKIDKEKKQE